MGSLSICPKLIIFCILVIQKKKETKNLNDMRWYAKLIKIRNIKILERRNILFWETKLIHTFCQRNFSTSRITMESSNSVMNAHVNDPLTLDNIGKAAKRIKGSIHCTPTMTCTYLDKLANGGSNQNRKLFFKCENFQKTGSFKVNNFWSIK